jgi:hypothetical protein
MQQPNLLTSDKVAAMFVSHPVSPLVTRKEVNYPSQSRIPTWGTSTWRRCRDNESCAHYLRCPESGP